MKASDLRGKSIKELQIAEYELLHERFNLYMQKASGQLSKPDQIKKVRRDIARINTVITEKGGRK